MATDSMRRLRRRAQFAALAVSLVLGACAGPGPATRPEIDLPERWPQADAGPAMAERWWTLFADPALDTLVDRALADNLDLRRAAERVLQARAAAGIADAARYPAVSAGASAQRSRSSLEGSFPLPESTPRIQTTYRVGLEAGYELDLWGRYGRASDAARADLLGAQWARQSVRLALIADVCNGYHALRAADLRVHALQRTRALRQEALTLLGHRVAAGSAAEVELHRTRAEIAAIDARLAEARRRREDLDTALGLLLGASPRALLAGTMASGGAAAEVPAPQVPAGLPSELLLRRPDLREAEAALAAADARVDEARARLFPSISLTASLGQESVSLSRLFDARAGIFGLGLDLTQPIWNAGRLRHGLAASEHAREEQVLRYRQAVAEAFGEVRRALAAQRAAAETARAELDRRTSLALALRQAGVRFDAGLSGRIEVLDAERGLLDAELAGIDAELAQREAITDLVRALGGGWPADPG